MINLMVVIVSVLSLITLFSSIASYLILSGFSFIGLSYIIVYVGAVSILFLFILMLINIRISELQNNTNNSIALSIIIAIYLHIILFIIPSYDTRGEILNYSNS
jgi:NADH-ubiquinone oxidoreductase chain 6